MYATYARSERAFHERMRARMRLRGEATYPGAAGNGMLDFVYAESDELLPSKLRLPPGPVDWREADLFYGSTRSELRDQETTSEAAEKMSQEQELEQGLVDVKAAGGGASGTKAAGASAPAGHQHVVLQPPVAEEAKTGSSFAVLCIKQTVNYWNSILERLHRCGRRTAEIYDMVMTATMLKRDGGNNLTGRASRFLNQDQQYRARIAQIVHMADTMSTTATAAEDLLDHAGRPENYHGRSSLALLEAALEDMIRYCRQMRSRAELLWDEEEEHTIVAVPDKADAEPELQRTEVTRCKLLYEKLPLHERGALFAPRGSWRPFPADFCFLSSCSSSSARPSRTTTTTGAPHGGKPKQLRWPRGLVDIDNAASSYADVEEFVFGREKDYAPLEEAVEDVRGQGVVEFSVDKEAEGDDADAAATSKERRVLHRDLPGVLCRVVAQFGFDSTRVEFDVRTKLGCPVSLKGVKKQIALQLCGQPGMARHLQILQASLEPVRKESAALTELLAETEAAAASRTSCAGPRAKRSVTETQLRGFLLRNGYGHLTRRAGIPALLVRSNGREPAHNSDSTPTLWSEDENHDQSLLSSLRTPPDKAAALPLINRNDEEQDLEVAEMRRERAFAAQAEILNSDGDDKGKGGDVEDDLAHACVAIQAHATWGPPAPALLVEQDVHDLGRERDEVEDEPPKPLEVVLHLVVYTKRRLQRTLFGRRTAEQTVVCLGADRDWGICTANLKRPRYLRFVGGSRPVRNTKNPADENKEDSPTSTRPVRPSREGGQRTFYAGRAALVQAFENDFEHPCVEIDRVFFCHVPSSTSSGTGTSSSSADTDPRRRVQVPLVFFNLMDPDNEMAGFIEREEHDAVVTLFDDTEIEVIIQLLRLRMPDTREQYYYPSQVASR